MSELDESLSNTLARQVLAEEASQNGDPVPRMEMWSTREAVTLFGAGGQCESRWEDVSKTFRSVAARYSNYTAYRFDVVAAGVSGNLAYTVGYECSSVSVRGGPVEPHTLRVTHVYRHTRTANGRSSTAMATASPSIRARVVTYRLVQPARRRNPAGLADV
jgi:ketosteroid isomerase-like protein